MVEAAGNCSVREPEMIKAMRLRLRHLQLPVQPDAAQRPRHRHRAGGGRLLRYHQPVPRFGGEVGGRPEPLRVPHLRHQGHRRGLQRVQRRHGVQRAASSAARDAYAKAVAAGVDAQVVPLVALDVELAPEGSTGRRTPPRTPRTDRRRSIAGRIATGIIDAGIYARRHLVERHRRRSGSRRPSTGWPCGSPRPAGPAGAVRECRRWSKRRSCPAGIVEVVQYSDDVT